MCFKFYNVRVSKYIMWYNKYIINHIQNQLKFTHQSMPRHCNMFCHSLNVHL